MIARDQLRSMFDRWSRLEEAKADIGGDLKDLFAEAKSNGYDTKALRAAFRHKAMSADEVAKSVEHETLVDLYLSELGVGTQNAIAHTRAAREATVTPIPRGRSDPAREAVSTHRPPEPSATAQGEGDREPSKVGAKPAARPSLANDDDFPDMPEFLRRTA